MEAVNPVTNHAAAYLRVSTTRQAEHDLSLPDQLRRIEAFCEAKGWELARTYEERGANATTDKRPESRRMIGEACGPAKPVDAVIIYSLSRFARDAMDAGFYERKLEQSGVKLYAVLEDFGDDANGRLIKAVLASQVTGLRAGLMLPQDRYNLLLRNSTPVHSPSLSSRSDAKSIWRIILGQAIGNEDDNDNDDTEA